MVPFQIRKFLEPILQQGMVLGPFLAAKISPRIGPKYACMVGPFLQDKNGPS